jgi:TPR repeat protein
LGAIFAAFTLLAGAGAQAGLQDAIDAYGKGNYSAALKEFKRLAAKGDVEAQSALGFMYGSGHGVKQDYKKAATWYRKAAEQGHAGAQSNLGVMYANGQGVPQNDAEAASWYRKAADQGYAAAQFNLGVMYANGQGVPQDLVQAHKLFSLAEATQGEVATNNRKLIEADMTPEQIAEAQALAREWSEKQKQSGQ